MAVRTFVCIRKKQTVFQAYVNLRSREDATFRVQKKKNCTSERAAKREEKRLLREATEQIARHEAKGNSWSRVISAFENEARELGINPVTQKPLGEKTLKNYLSMVRAWTQDWMNIPARDLSRRHGKELLKSASEADVGREHISKLKGVVDNIYDFGVQEGIIKDATKSPVFGLPVSKKKSESLKEILTVEEVQKLIFEAYRHKSEWADVWALALMTGMRSSELFALRKDNVRLEEGLIRVNESWDWEKDCAKQTKVNEWRSTPIAGKLKPIIDRLMTSNKGSEFLLPRIREWEQGHQAKALRSFCEHIGIRSVKFHTLRACFATHLLASGVHESTVRRIGGWASYKTFEIYVRLSGINERGATEGLGEIFFKDPEKIVEHVSNVYAARAA